MIVSGNTIETEGLGNFLKSLGQNLAFKDANNPNGALENAKYLSTFTAKRNPKAIVATTTSFMKFIHHGKGL